MLAGFWGRKGDGHPGAEVMGRGLEILTAVVEYRKVTGQTSQPSRAKRKRPRKPG
jgi:hypothetical protein